MSFLIIMLICLPLALLGEYAYRRHKGEPVSLKSIFMDLTEDDRGKR